MRHIAFTASRSGLTPEQRQFLEKILPGFYNQPVVWHLGDCVGGDVEIAQLLHRYKGLVWVLYAHPCDLTAQRAYFDKYDLEDPALPPLKRNRVMVDLSTNLYAFPSSFHEVQRSGTWATIRYAYRRGKMTTIINPDGQCYFYVRKGT